ncbi:MAG: hypothetical protein V9F00_14180 [Nocardioides sp.]
MGRRPAPRRADPKARTWIGFLLVAVVLSVYGGRVVQLQGVDPESLADRAAAEGKVTVPLVARRGQITDRFGEPLATSIDGLAISVDPSQTKEDANELATLFARRLGVDYFTVLKRLRGDGYFRLCRPPGPGNVGQRCGRGSQRGWLQGHLHRGRSGARLPGP